MEWQLCLSIIFSVAMLCSTESAQEIYSRSRRSSLNFGNMIRCTTGRNPLDYIDYGCYCGLGGKGKTLDGVDRCCHAHDNCYRQLRRRGVCFRLALYFSHYKHSCSNCSSKNKGCSRELCRCDRKAARCFKRNKYNPGMKNVDRSKVC